MHYLIYILIAYLPFQLALNPAEGVDLASIRVLIVLFFLIWLWRGMTGSSLKIAASPISLWLLFFLFLAGISIFFATEISWALRKFLYLCSVFPLYFLISDASLDIKLHKIIKILIIIAVIISIISLAQFGLQFFVTKASLIDFWATKIGPIFYGQSLGKVVAQNPSWLVEIKGTPLFRALAFFPDPHMLSFYLGMILPFSLFGFLPPHLIRADRRRRSNPIKALIRCGGVLAGLIILAALLLTFSRGGYLGLVISCLVVLVCVWRHLSFPQRRGLIIFGFLIILVLAIFARPTINRFVSIFNWQEGSNFARIKIWQESLGVWLGHPLFGIGLGNYPAWVNWSAPYWGAVTSHNLYLDILTETGIFSLITWLVLIFGTIFWLGQRTKKAESSQEGIFALSLLGSLVYFSVHSFFETAIFNPTILALLMVVLGLAARIKKARTARNR